MKVIHVISLLLVLILLAGCGSSLEVPAPEADAKEMVVDDQNKEDKNLPSEPAAPISDAQASAVKEFRVKGNNFKFDISEINVNKGDTVKIIFENVEGTHNIFVENYDVRTPVKTGPATDEITFVADTTGEFSYWCEVGTHRQLGMEGKLIVQ